MPLIEIFNPISIVLFSLAIISLVLDIIFKKWFIKIIFALLTTGAIIFSLLYGVPYQQVLIVILVLVVIELFTYYPIKKKENNNEL